MENKQKSKNNQNMRNGIYQAKSIQNVINSGLSFIEKGDKTEAELRTRLGNKTENKEWIEEVVEKFISYGYIRKDPEFSIRFAEMALGNNYGPKYISTKLRKRGISEFDIDEAISTVYEKQNIDEKTLIEIRLQDVDFANTSREKLSNGLISKGFLMPDILSVIKRMDSDKVLRTNAEIKGEKASKNLKGEIMKLYNKGKGKSLIGRELKAKHIHVEDCDLSEIIIKLESDGEIDFFEMALLCLSKKKYNVMEYKDKSKAYSFLQRRGFGSEEIKYAIEELTLEVAR